MMRMGPPKTNFRLTFSQHSAQKAHGTFAYLKFFVGDYAKGRPDDNVKDLSTYFMTYLQSLQINHRKMTTINEGRTVYEASSQRSRIEKRKKTVRSSQLLIHIH